MLPPSIVVNGTAGTWMTARLNCSLIGSATPGPRERHAAPSCPRRRAARRTPCRSSRPTSDSESTWMMRSPSRTPPSSAGVCGKTRLTTTLVVRRRLLLLEQHADAAVASADAAIELVVLLRREQLAVRIVQLAHEAVRRLLVDRPRPAASRRSGSRRARAPDRTAGAWRAPAPSGGGTRRRRSGSGAATRRPRCVDGTFERPREEDAGALRRARRAAIYRPPTLSGRRRAASRCHSACLTRTRSRSETGLPRRIPRCYDL